MCLHQHVLCICAWVCIKLAHIGNDNLDAIISIAFTYFKNQITGAIYYSSENINSSIYLLDLLDNSFTCLFTFGFFRAKSQCHNHGIHQRVCIADLNYFCSHLRLNTKKTSYFKYPVFLVLIYYEATIAATTKSI